MSGLFTEEMLPQTLKDLLKDMPEDKKAAFIDIYMKNMMLNSTQGTNVPPMPSVDTTPFPSMNKNL